MRPFRGFKDVISSEDELREIVGHPGELAQKKSITFLDRHCREFIAKSPFVLIATSDQTGKCDVSPRGDAAGFVHIVDDSHLVIPERTGNRRMDSMRNILTNPNIGLIFIIPGLSETLRVNGRATITKDPSLLEQMEVNGNVPKVGIGVQVEECFLHCAKAFIRSKLWDVDTWPSQEQLPKPAKILADHVNMEDVTEQQVEVILKESYTQRLY